MIKMKRLVVILVMMIFISGYSKEDVQGMAGKDTVYTKTENVDRTILVSQKNERYNYTYEHYEVMGESDDLLPVVEAEWDVIEKAAAKSKGKDESELKNAMKLSRSKTTEAILTYDLYVVLTDVYKIDYKIENGQTVIINKVMEKTVFKKFQEENVRSNAPSFKNLN